MSIFGWMAFLGLIWAFFRWCFFPTMRVILQIVDPDEEALVQADVVEITKRIAKSDETMDEAANRVRERLGLRNAAHSLVKILDPYGGNGVVLSAATHPDYLALAIALTKQVSGRALVFRATEGEPYFNPKRCPAVTLVHGSTVTPLVEADTDSLTELPDVPIDLSIEKTVEWTNAVLKGDRPIPKSMLDQLACIWLASHDLDDLCEARSCVRQLLHRSEA